MNVNKAIISGRLTRDPELKNIGEVELCSFRLASNRKVGKKRIEKTTFIDVDVWGGQAKPCSQFISKGSRVCVDGVLCHDTWDAPDGKTNSKVYIEADNVVFLDLPENDNNKGDDKPAKKTPKPKNEVADEQSSDDDLPF